MWKNIIWVSGTEIFDRHWDSSRLQKLIAAFNLVGGFCLEMLHCRGCQSLKAFLSLSAGLILVSLERDYVCGWITECTTGSSSDTRSWFRDILHISPLSALKDTDNLHVLTSLVYDPLWPLRDPAEDDKEQGRHLPTHLSCFFLRVCAAATFDEWEERLGHL